MPVEHARQDFVVVAHRLPIDRCEGEWVSSSYGLASTLAPIVRDHRGAWVGCSDADGEHSEPFEFDGMKLIPLDLDAEEYRDFYEGFSKATLRPLYHDVVVPAEFRRSWWNAYRYVNARYAQAAVETAAPGATIWVHDYHLQLVPEMIRNQRPDVRIGFFSHLPFPPVELFAQLPWRSAVVRGILAADVIGFQLESDVKNFHNAARKFADRDTAALETTLGAYPTSIDARTIHDLAEVATTQCQARQMRTKFGNPETLLIGIDQLDYAKGIVHRLRAYEELLEDGAIDPQTTALVQIAVPSREGQASCQELRDEIEQLVGRINGRFGTLEGAAIYYCYRSYSLEEMVALYLAADALLATSLRDGMNLVAKEYVAARRGQGGALVLSEFTGAANELNQALLVNPHDVDELKLAIRQAVQMPGDEARRRIDAMADIVDDHDSHWWAGRFLSALKPAGSLSAYSASPTTQSVRKMRVVPRERSLSLYG